MTILYDRGHRDIDYESFSLIIRFLLIYQPYNWQIRFGMSWHSPCSCNMRHWPTHHRNRSLCQVQLWQQFKNIYCHWLLYFKELRCSTLTFYQMAQFSWYHPTFCYKKKRKIVVISRGPPWMRGPRFFVPPPNSATVPKAFPPPFELELKRDPVWIVLWTTHMMFVSLQDDFKKVEFWRTFKQYFLNVWE